MTDYFSDVARACALFSEYLRDRREQIHAALADYASFPAVEDEIARAAYVLDNIGENREYFQWKAGEAAAFLPRNQLLYATVYMGVIPALMANQCHVRPPESAHSAYRRLLEAVDFERFFPTLHFFLGNRGDFVASRVPPADIVIFTGTYANGELVRKQARKDALFIFSGSGHNPVVVRRDADLAQAADAIVRLCYHNQGQDCSAPNAILADRAIASPLFARLHERTLSVEASMRLGRHAENMIAPNTDRAHLATTAENFVRLQQFLVHGGVLDTRTQIISPTIFQKPLKHGPQLTEFFAPVIMLQEYDAEEQLPAYFSHPGYRPNAMYMTVFGRHPRIEALGALDIHPPETLLHNRDLHEEEKGTNPYGGYGPKASFVVSGGSRRPTPILPQREIHQYLAALREDNRGARPAGQKKIRTARDARFEKLKQLDGGRAAIYPPHFTPTVCCRELSDKYEHLGHGVYTEDRVIAAGRVVAHRNSGMFLDLRDASGKIQIFCHPSQLDEHACAVLKCIDTGDLLGVEGSVRRTQRGELTIAASHLTLLAKDLLTEAGAGPAVWSSPHEPRRTMMEMQREFLTQSEAVAAVRTFMNGQRYQETATWAIEPERNTSPMARVEAGAAPALRVIGVVAEGFSDLVYEINGQTSRREADLGQPLRVDAVRAFADWKDMAVLAEDLVNAVVRRLCEAGFTHAGGAGPSLSFATTTMIAAVEAATGIDFAGIRGDDDARAHAASLGCAMTGNESWGECIALVFEKKAAPELTGPVHITHLPKAIARLAVADHRDARLAECFSTYMNGRLICTGFTLLNDPFEHREREPAGTRDPENADEQRERSGEHFTRLLERGIPPSAVITAELSGIVTQFGAQCEETASPLGAGGYA